MRSDFINTVGKSGSGMKVDSMDFDGMCKFYAVFSSMRDSEMANIAFEMIKKSALATTLKQDDLAFWCGKVLGYDQKYVTEYYHLNLFDPRVAITKEEFLGSLCGLTQGKVRKLPMFAVIPKMNRGFEDDYLNMNEDTYEDATADVQTGPGKEMTDREKMRKKKVNDYFIDNINGKSSDFVVSVYQKLFHYVENQDVKNYFLSQITKFKANDQGFFEYLINQIVLETSQTEKLGLMFKIFSNFNFKQ